MKKSLYLLSAFGSVGWSFSLYASGQSPETLITETELAGAHAGMQTGIFERSMQAGPVVFSVLLTLVALSILSWAVVFGKLWYLRRMELNSVRFIKSFWDSRSLNDLNSKLADHPYSPVREIFRSGYAELVRGSQLRDQAVQPEWAIHAAIENLGRSLNKAKILERKQMERFLSVLSITASVSPFIGLFGTVWGIMTSFESIAAMGSASLAAVAPGISEALIATAFGLGAAIPAVIGYNLANSKIRGLFFRIEGFGADFLNIVERYLVSDRSKSSNSSTPVQPSRI